ncbi:hypothetical protein [Glaciimonas soli]|uniref:Uncharacterized protein n=1 Tax=Glaciimonas soli TaxID=2590999 RepID=A0A843YRT1_9BURK|nr:hypothetical protein [Glaciimonas soli]MQR02459.1 hypothetical protein [Glaciimonas soli]
MLSCDNTSGLVSSGDTLPTREPAFICTSYLAPKELLRYVVMMQVARKQTIFDWTSSDQKVATVALLEPMTFHDRKILPAGCICIWISRPDTCPECEEDLTLPDNFRVGELVNVLDQAALRLLELKAVKTDSASAHQIANKNYRISRWINLQQSFFSIRFQKILVVMTKKAIGFDWLLSDGGLSEQEAFSFLDELRKYGVLVEQIVKVDDGNASSKEIVVEPHVIGVNSLVKKMKQWLSRARSDELERSR